MLRNLFYNLLIILATVVVFLIFLEIGVRVVSPQPVNISGTRPSETLRYENVPNAAFTLKTSEYVTRVRYNNMGFRDEDFRIEKDKFRVAVIGDSYVEALQVPYDTMFANQLEDLLNADSDEYEVMNFGVSGYGTDQELLMLKEKVLRYDPNVVLLYYVHNDIQEVYTNHLVTRKDGGLHFRNYRQNFLWKSFKGFVKNLHTYYFIKRKILQLPVLSRAAGSLKALTYNVLGEKVMERLFPQIAKDVRHNKDRTNLSVEMQAFLKTQNEPIEELWDLEFRLIKEMKKTAREKGSCFGVVVVTKIFQLDEPALDEYLKHYDIDRSMFVVDKPNRTLVDFANNNDIPIMDLYPLFKKRADSGELLHFRIDGHWNERGNTLAAEETYRFLVDSDLLSPADTMVRR